MLSGEVIRQVTIHGTQRGCRGHVYSCPAEEMRCRGCDMGQSREDPAMCPCNSAKLQESTTSYGEVYCVSKVLPGPLSETAAFTRSFFPEFGDTRALHTGAEFHATGSFARPAAANETVLQGRTALYTKGPAVLHMVGSYMDATMQQVRSAPHSACMQCVPCMYEMMPTDTKAHGM